MTIVCVYNDADVLAECLAASVDKGWAEAPGTQLVAVDNRSRQFSSAGAALNHGVRQAVNEVVAFAHQDVVLHSLADLERAAARLRADHRIGVLGAIGMDESDALVGTVRDRIVEVGRAAAEPTDVHTLDEVLFLVRREQLEREPLSEHPLLSWHAYAVEYCARMRDRGLRAAAVDIPLTHNSLTVNLKDLDLAHRHVGELYPAQLPLRTTCGTIWPGGAPRGARRVGHYAQRARVYWTESVTARLLQRAFPASPVMIADLRLSIDDVLERSGCTTLLVIDVDADDSSVPPVSDLTRFGRRYSAVGAAVEDARRLLEGRAADELIVVIARSPRSLERLGSLDDIPHVMGLTHDTGVWVAAGVTEAALRPLWSRRRNRPLPGVFRARRPASTFAGSAA